MKQIFLFFFAFCATFSLFSQSYQYGIHFQDGDVISTCSGKFWDSNGPGYYNPGEEYYITFCPSTPGTYIDLDFVSFDINNVSHFEIFNADNPDPALSFGIFTNQINPVNMIVRATAGNASGCLTVYFRAGTANGAGWEANISCQVPCQLLFARIDSLNTDPMPNDTNYIAICPGQPVTFVGFGEYPENNIVYNQSDDSCLFIWNFGDGNIDTGRVISHTYQDVKGYDVSVKIIDQNGCVSTNLPTTRVMISQNPLSNIQPLEPLCAYDTQILSVGYDPNSTISIVPVGNVQGASLELADTTFLPDGSGVSYTTSVTFTVFEAGQTLTNIDDLYAICANMEHSYMGDLSMRLICPNGQQITMFNQGGSGTIIGEPVATNLPVDGNSSDIRPGIGYDYCWSPTSTNGTIHNNANWTNVSPYTDPVGNVSTSNPINQLNPGTYEISGNWNNLLGCPLNGTWTIHVTDHLPQDNGYIFSWGIDFNPDLIPGNWSYDVPFESVDWQSPYISQINDTIFNFLTEEGGVYDVVVTVLDAFGCQYDTTLTITVVDLPIVDLGDDIAVCRKDAPYITIDGTTEHATHYLWSNMTTGETMLVDYDGIYAVTAINNAHSISCLTSDTVNVTFIRTPIFSLIPDTCIENPIMISVIDPDIDSTYRFKWSTNETTESIYVNQTGTYTVEVWINAEVYCGSGNGVFIQYIPTPTLNLGSNRVICDFDTLVFQANTGNQSPDYTYEWSMAEFQGAIANFGPKSPGEYLLAVTKRGCSNVSDEVLITVEDCSVTIPNVITPDDNGINDYFVIDGLENYENVSFVLFNRWGRKVYENNDYRNNFKGDNLKDGTYFYIITFPNNLKGPFTGPLAIIRN